jgi:hypothetical protein
MWWRDIAYLYGTGVVIPNFTDKNLHNSLSLQQADDILAQQMSQYFNFA